MVLFFVFLENCDEATNILRQPLSHLFGQINIKGEFIISHKGLQNFQFELNGTVLRCVLERIVKKVGNDLSIPALVTYYLLGV